MSNGSCLSRHECWLSWEEQDGEEFAMLNFSDDLIDELGWSVDDVLEWIDNEDGTYSIVKREHE
jgi:hypothetical protein